MTTTITQRAVLIRAYGGAAAAEVAETARPTAGQGQVLVRVRAAGVNGIDWKIREGFVRDAFPLQLPAVLGIAPALAPVAALGVVFLMLGATIVHIRRHEYQALLVPVLLIALAAFVAWGRFGPEAITG